MTIKLLGAASALVLLSSVGFSQSLDNEGTEFLCAFLHNHPSENPDIELHLTADTATMVTVNYPVGAPTFTQTVAVGPGAITEVVLPLSAAEGWFRGFTLANLVSATAPEEFTCYMINRTMFTSDAALALPVDTMNTEFFIADWDPTGSAVPSDFVVYAAFDNTTVTITPSADLIGNGITPFQVTLNAGEGYYGSSMGPGPTGSLTGTLIEADRIVGVTNGTSCVNIPSNITFCDHIFEVAQPVQTWGNDFLVANVPHRPQGSYYRVLGSVDGTDVLVDGVSTGVVNRGEFLQIGPLPGDHRIESSGGQAIFVVQYMTGGDSPGAGPGDPSMSNVISIPQYKSDYTFSTVGGAQFVEHHLVVICADIDVGSLLLDGVAVPAANFAAIAGSGFSRASLPITEGTHTTSSSQGHTIAVMGYNDDDSYMYPGGALFDLINPVGDANHPVCDGSLFAERFEGTAEDSRPTEDTNGNGVLDPGEDLNNNGLIDQDTGVFFMQLDAASSNLDLVVAPFAPGDPLVNFEVTQVNVAQAAQGAVIVTDGAGNTSTCPVAFNASIGMGVCDPAPNSTGERALTVAAGSHLASANDLTLTTTGLPSNSLGFYLVSQGNGIVVMPGSHGGSLCIAGPVMGRHNQSLQNSGTGTSVSFAPDLTQLPHPLNSASMVLSGESWSWQYWYRDNDLAPGASNFCGAVQVDFQ